jgi:hypothetical protein
VAKHQAHTDLDGHEGHRQRGEKLEDAAGEERDAQGRHGRLRICLAELAQVSARAFFASQRTQCGQAGHEIEKLGGQALHGVQLVLGGRLGESADEDHKDRDEGHDEQGDEGRPEVEQKNDAEGRRRHGAHEDQLGQEGHEVGA